jgi:hypothetical protein
MNSWRTLRRRIKKAIKARILHDVKSGAYFKSLPIRVDY